MRGRSIAQVSPSAPATRQTSGPTPLEADRDTTVVPAVDIPRPTLHTAGRVARRRPRLRGRGAPVRGPRAARSATCRWSLGVALGLAVDRRLGRDLALIALGQAIISTISLKADLSNVGMLRFTVALGLAVVVPTLLSSRVFHDDKIHFPVRTGRRWDRWQALYLVAVAIAAYLILPCVLPRLRRVAELARPGRVRATSRGCSSGSTRWASGTSCSSSAWCSPCCGRTSRSGWPTCCRRRCSCRSCGSWATASGVRC